MICVGLHLYDQKIPIGRMTEEEIAIVSEKDIKTAPNDASDRDAQEVAQKN
uniref:AlNc14C336G10738 protein n=1 Tax=Albugo laibachii Nc14 TaxID=890382 RepID=F0WWX7_9STRA|nr:AlNc14C336G10738 [Albugo laibachii Nc14]|eukprot:CCA25962.1 AlNc14C336G10738 [Albugo laibachii Nc14]